VETTITAPGGIKVTKTQYTPEATKEGLIVDCYAK
jgi:hypothetical protein